MTELFGIRFAPLHIPLHRRLQTLAVLHWIICVSFFGPFNWVLLIALLWTRYYPITLIYLAWFIYDWHTPARGGRRLACIRSWCLWKHFADFFPVSLVRTTSLPADRNYILCSHPHGIMGNGTFVNFATDATGCARLFPGLRFSLLTVAFPLCCPLLREYLMTTGTCLCTHESMCWLLTQQGQGNVLVLVVGGAREALSAWPGSFNVYLKKRKGFIRIALETGTSLVPVFSFGENDVFEQKKPGRRLHWFQMKTKNLFGFSTPIFYGRGIFNYTFGMLPFRRPITTVVGSPIDVEKVPDPTDEQVDALHALYVDSLVKLFESHKQDYGVSADQHLCIT